MSTMTITCSEQEITKIKQRLAKGEVKKTPPYAHYQIKVNGCVITAYLSGKVVFQGDDAEFYAQGYTPANTKDNKKKKPDPYIAKHEDSYPQCGSDEVGTGDYFGPVIVCAAYVGAEDVEYLRDLGIQDSKAINDTQIRILAPKLMERLPYSLLVLDNAIYNRIHDENNMVAIKCKLHNQAFVHLKKKLKGLPDFIIIDQFVQGSSYYRYLKQEKEVISNIHFETKAENKYLSVACGSIIARYTFLKAFDVMCTHYDFPFLKGASSKVDENIKDFVNQHSKQALYDVAKVHFINTKKAGIII